jgi:hypothetical protein
MVSATVGVHFLFTSALASGFVAVGLDQVDIWATGAVTDVVIDVDTEEVQELATGQGTGIRHSGTCTTVTEIRRAPRPQQGLLETMHDPTPWPIAARPADLPAVAGPIMCTRIRMATFTVRQIKAGNSGLEMAGKLPVTDHKRQGNPVNNVPSNMEERTETTAVTWTGATIPASVAIKGQVATAVVLDGVVGAGNYS